MAFGLLDPNEAYRALWESVEDALAGNWVEVPPVADPEFDAAEFLESVETGLDKQEAYQQGEPYDNSLFFTMLFAAAWRERKIFWQHLDWYPDTREVFLSVSCTERMQQQLLPGF